MISVKNTERPQPQNRSQTTTKRTRGTDKNNNNRKPHRDNRNKNCPQNPGRNLTIHEREREIRALVKSDIEARRISFYFLLNPYILKMLISIQVKTLKLLMTNHLLFFYKFNY